MLVEKDLRRLRRESQQPPDLLQPLQLYEERKTALIKSAQGVEKLVYGFIPFSLIKSFALAIDPLKKFRAVPVKIAPTSRTRYRTRVDVLQIRKIRRLVIHRYGTTPPNYEGHLLQFGPVQWSSNISDNTSPSYPARIPDPTMTTKDTTMRTRPANSNYGEFEHFEYTMHSPSLTTTRTYDSFVQLTLDNGSVSKDIESSSYTNIGEGPLGYLSSGELETLQQRTKEDAESLMQREVLGLLAKVMPLSRRYSAFRNVIELRDVPRMILSLKRSMEDLARVEAGFFGSSVTNRGLKVRETKLLKDVPNEYVSYWFGWNQLYRDITDLVDKPIRAAREVNRLLERSGKATTYRIKKEVPSRGNWAPDFRYEGYQDESSVSVATHNERVTELRLVINATFDFPKINIPRFKQELFLEKMGVYPRATDIYNLIPWSWLVDWFTGLGNYIDAVDVINTDPSLVNYGFLTAVTRGKIISTRSSKVWSQKATRILPGPWVGEDFARSYLHTSICEYKYQCRRNITTAYDVKTILEPANLSLLQKSILSALLLARGTAGRTPQMGR